MPDKIRETATSVYQAFRTLKPRERDEMLDCILQDRQTREKLLDRASAIKDDWDQPLKLTAAEARRLNAWADREDAEGRTMTFASPEAFVAYCREQRVRQKAR